MKPLWLSRKQVGAIIAHARQDAPHEACGIIAGRDNRAAKVIPVDNVAANPQTTYVMDPVALAYHLPQIDRYGLTLIGLYHSHPAGDPIPSQTDIRKATYQRTPYVIVGLKGQQPELAAWTFNGPRVQHVELHIGDNPPPHVDEPLSKAQHIAIGISAVIAFFALITIALSLLPPAPPVP